MPSLPEDDLQSAGQEVWDCALFRTRAPHPFANDALEAHAMGGQVQRVASDGRGAGRCRSRSKSEERRELGLCVYGETRYSLHPPLRLEIHFASG
jgi:hypothetical protein